MSNPDFPTDHLRDDVSATAGTSDSDVVESPSGEGLTIGGQLGELPSETPEAEADDMEDDADEVGDINPTDLDGSADEVEQQVRENGAP